MHSKLLGLRVYLILVKGVDAMDCFRRSGLILLTRAMLYRLIEVKACAQIRWIRGLRSPAVIESSVIVRCLIIY
jgi:hypothetical protein